MRDRLGWLCLLGAPFLMLAALRLGAGFDGLYGQDAYEYARYAAALKDWWGAGGDPGWHYWTPGYATLGAVLLWLGVPSAALALQLVSAFGLAALGACVALCGRGPGAPWFALLCVLLPPALMRAGVLAMSDIAALACAAGALLCWLQFRDARAPALALGFALAAGGAILIRPVCGLLLLLPALDGARLLLVHRQWAALAGALGVGLGALWLLSLSPGWRPHEMAQTQHLAQWSLANWTARAVTTPDGTLAHPVPNLAFALTLLGRPGHWPLLILLPFARPADLVEAVPVILLGTALLFLLFVAGAPTQSARHLMPAHLPVALLLWPAWRRALHWLRSWARPAVMGLAVILLALLPRALAPLLDQSRFEREVARALQGKEAPVLYTFSLTPALKGRGVALPLHDLWTPLGAIQPGALVLFNPEALSGQWEGTPVLQNWDRLGSEHRLILLQQLDRGWRLWRVVP